MCVDEKKVVGVLLGLAAGDKIGGPTQMALRVAESLCDRSGIDMSDIGERYIDWWHNGAFDTGPTTAQVLSLVASGVLFEQAAVRVDDKAGGMTAGCNPAHRGAPLAMCASIKDCGVGRTAVSEARYTHRHPLAGDVSAAVACLCRALIRGVSWPVALEVAAEGRKPETRRALEASSCPQRDGYAPHVLSAAVHFVGGSDNFSAALTSSIEFAGPDNYCPVLVGSIAGARWGVGQIQEEAIRHHGDLVPRLKTVALALASEWKIVET